MKNGTPQANGRGQAPADQAKALALVLREEFGVPLAFYETETGSLVWFDDIAELRERTGELEPAEVLALANEGRARVRLSDLGYLQFALPLCQGGRGFLVATGALPALTISEPQASAEVQRVQRWVQAVGDRLRSADQMISYRVSADEQGTQVKQAWEVIFTLDHLLRHLRLHKDPQKNEKRILQAAHELLHVQTLVWIPLQPDAAVVVHGEPCLALSDCRQLASHLAKSIDAKSSGPLVCNNVQENSWGTVFPTLTNLMAFRVVDQRLTGWVIAVNKRTGVRGQGAEVGEDGGPGSSPALGSRPPTADFRRSDAALLTPFVGLLEMHERGSRRYQDLKTLLVGLTRSLTSALDTKDSYTYGHSERVARIAVELGRELGLGEDELGDIYLAGLLHDVGKIGIRDAVLGKSEPLTPEEFEHIKQHVTMGYAILADLGQIRNLLPGVLYHHERYDGTGYPDGLAGDAIPLLARILAVADAYDAMSTTRPYRQAMPCRRVEEILLEGAGRQWDKRIIEAFVRCRHKIHAIRQRGVGESLRHAIEGALRKADQSCVVESPSMAQPVFSRSAVLSETGTRDGETPFRAGTRP